MMITKKIGRSFEVFIKKIIGFVTNIQKFHNNVKFHQKIDRMVRIVNFYQFQFLQNKQREQNKTKVEFKDYNP